MAPRLTLLGPRALSLGQGNPYTPQEYTRGDVLVNPTRTPEKYTGSWYRSFADAFSEDERAQLQALMRERSGMGEADLRRLEGMLNTRGKVAAFTGEFFRQSAPKVQAAKEISVLDALRSASIDCVGRARIVAYFNSGEQRAATILSAAPRDRYHTIVPVQNEAGSWDIADGSRVLHTGATQVEEALRVYEPGALRLSLAKIDREGGALHFGSEVLETVPGLQVKTFPHIAPDSALSDPTFHLTPAEAHDLRLSLRADSHGTTLSAKNGDWSLDLRAWNGLEKSLNAAVGAALRYQPTAGLSLSAGAMHLPFMAVREYSLVRESAISDRSAAMTAEFIGVDASTRLAELRLSKHLSLAQDLDFRGAAIFAPSKGNAQLETLNELSHADVTTRTELRASARGASLWSRFTGYVPLVDEISYLSRKGPFADLPITGFYEVGASYRSARLSLDGAFYDPLRTATNLFADERRWRLSLSVPVSQNGPSITATAHGDFDGQLERAALATAWRGGSISASIERPQGERPVLFVEGRVNIF